MQNDHVLKQREFIYWRIHANVSSEFLYQYDDEIAAEILHRRNKSVDSFFLKLGIFLLE